MGILPAYPKVRRTQYCAMLGGWPVAWKGGSLRKVSEGDGGWRKHFGVNVQLQEGAGKQNE